MKKVLFLTRSYYPNIGGVEKHIWFVSKQLIKNGYSVQIITEKPYKNNNLNKYVDKNIEVIHIPCRKENKIKKFIIWFSLFKKINIIRDADIIHCHDVFYWYLPFRFLFYKKKVYTTFHGYEGNKIPNLKSKFMHKMAEKLSFGNICVGDFFNKWYNTKPTFVIYGGASVGKSRRINQSNFKKAVYVGRLEEEAGIMEYIKAMKMLKDNKYNFHLDVYGEGSLFHAAHRFVNKYKLDVSFKGFVYEIEKIIPKYKYVFVSRYLGILEALAANRIVLAVYNNAIKKDYLEMTPFRKIIYISQNSQRVYEDIMQIEKQINYNRNNNLFKIPTWEDVAKVYMMLWK